MIGVTSEIKRLLKEKDRAIRSGEEAMQGIMANLHKQIMSELGGAALTSWDTYRLKQLLGSIEDIMGAAKGKATRELSGLLDTMWDRGGAIVDSPLRQAGLLSGSFRIGRSSIEALKDYSSSYLEKLFGDAWYGIKGEINLGVLGVKTAQEVTAAIGTSMRSGRFANYANRAETITRTEMGRIFSEATQNRMEDAAGYVDGLEKQWIHAGYPHEPRPTHLAVHGQHVPVKNPFQVGAYRMMFPRDPKAPVSEIIHCGCDHVPYHARWENEPTIERESDKIAFPGIKNKEMRQYAESAFENAPEKIRRITDKFGPSMKFRKSKTEGSHYNPKTGSICINAGQIQENRFDAFRHEFGHFVDLEGGVQRNPVNALSVRGAFSGVLQREGSRILADADVKNRLLADIAREEGIWFRERSVSDLFGAVTSNEIVGYYGHFLGYYDSRPKWGRQLQAFANLFDIYVQQKKVVVDYVSKELPDLWNAFEGIINGL